MHHKRKRPKSTRCGCLLCKPYKRQGSKLPERLTFSTRRRVSGASADMRAEDLGRFDRGFR